MSEQNTKWVMIINENLPLGLIANTAAVIGVTLGKNFPEAVGTDVYDKSGKSHLGLIEFPIPILKGNVDLIKETREKLYHPEFSELIVVDFSDVAQTCKNYEEFGDKLLNTAAEDLNYLGIAICGNKKQVNKLTGHLPLLR